MKIGPVDIRVHALVYVAAVLVLGIVVLNMWRSNSGVRLEGYYRGAILAGMNSDSTPVQQEAIDACKSVLNVSPQNANVRLYLAALLMKQKKFVEAETAAQETADLPAITPDEKAYAWVGAGVAHFRAVSGDEPAKYAAAAAECEKNNYFKKAVDSQNKNGDALANLACCKALQKPGAVSPLLKSCDEAMAGSPAPSLSGEQQMYTLKGLALLEQGKAFDALAEFERAQALQPAGLPGLPDPHDNRRLGMLAGMLQKDVSTAQRLTMIELIEHEIGRFGKQEVVVLNALGLARWMLSSDADYARKHFKDARRNFNDAINKYPKDPHAYLNQAAIVEDRIADLVKNLGVQVPSLNGDPPQVSPWDERGKVEIAPADEQIKSEISGLLYEEDKLWDLFFAKVVDASPAERVRCKLLQLSCVRRLVWLTTDNNRKVMLTRALAIAEELTKISPSDPMTHFTQGEVFLEQGLQVKALTAFTLAKSNGTNTPQLDQLLAQIGNSPGMTDIRPSKNGPSFGAVPLVRVTLSGVNINAVQACVMTFDGRQVQASRVGSQVMFLPKADELKDGKHTIGVTINDGSGAPVALPPFNFVVNKKPPVWVIGEPVGNPPVWEITLTDEVGIDYSSLQLTLKNAAGGFKRDLVKSGKLFFPMPNLQLKQGDKISTDKFKISSGTDQPLLPGTYTLTIDVHDNATNGTLEISRGFDVK